MNTKNIIIFCTTIIIIGILFWPTIYRYDKLTVGNNTYPIKINRLTGYTELFSGGEWIQQEKTAQKSFSLLPYQDKIKVTGRAGFTFNFFDGKIYNGTDFTLTRLLIRVVAKGKDGEIRWDRKFKTDVNIQPLATGSLFFDVGDTQDVDSEWNIEDIWGYKER